MNRLLRTNKKMKSSAAGILPLLAIAVALVPFCLSSVHAKAPPQEIEKANVIMIGDRLIDVAYHLGVIPAAMSARASMWPLARELGRTSSRLLGCPKCVTVKNPGIVPETILKLGIHRLLIETSPQFCLYEPKVSPEKVVGLLEQRDDIKQLDVTVEYVDFGKGLDAAIRRTGSLLGREKAAEDLIKAHAENLARVRGKLPKQPAGKTVVVFDGVYQQATGKAFVRVEASGGYSDRFLLGPLGLKNVGSAFFANGKKPEKGYVIVRKLDALLEAKPDAIVVTGDADAVQRMLFREMKRQPALMELSALRNGAVFALPRYVDSGVIEYPRVLQRWVAAFSGK